MQLYFDPGVHRLVPNAALLDAHRRMHQLLSELGAVVHEHYAPDTWVPHSTIGFELPGERLATFELRALAPA